MMRRFRARDGFTLIEIMVATLLLLVAMAGFVPFFLQGLNQSTLARYRSVATNIARQRMEQVRQLDYREVSQETLIARFGTTDVMRGTTFTTSYIVADASSGLKNVTVSVTWAAPPVPSPVSVTTLINQRFLGPRGSRLTVEQTVLDDLGSPFPLLNTPETRTIKYYIAEADWGLIYPNPSTSPDSDAYNVYARMVLVDDNGFGVKLGDSANDYEIPKTQLHRTWVSGILTEVYFELSGVTGVNPAMIPDGYWELQAAAFNAYDEPGNLWRLRVRRESGPPAAPTPFEAIGQTDGQTILLTWTPGLERDRDHFVLQRSISDNDSSWSEFTTLDASVGPTATSYTDTSSVSPPKTHPWGDLGTTNYYKYELRAVDFASPANTGDASTAKAQLPPLPGETTTVPLPTTTPPPPVQPTTLVYSISIKNSSNTIWSVTIEDASNVQVPLPNNPPTIAVNGTLIVPSLTAGAYQITVSASGRSAVVESFSLPAQAGTIVLTIL